MVVALEVPFDVVPAAGITVTPVPDELIIADPELTRSGSAVTTAPLDVVLAAARVASDVPVDADRLTSEHCLPLIVNIEFVAIPGESSKACSIERLFVKERLYIVLSGSR